MAGSVKLHLVVDNSGGRVGRSLTKKRGVKVNVLLGAQVADGPMKRQAVREATKGPPVAHAGGADAKPASDRSGATQGFDNFVNSHAGKNNPSCLEKSSSLDLGKQSGRDSGIIGPMTELAKIRTDAHPRHVDAIAGRLLLLRESLGLSQSEFAKRAGLGPTTYNNYERGLGRPELDKALQICDAFQVTLDWIYTGNPAGIPYEVASKVVGGNR